MNDINTCIVLTENIRSLSLYAHVVPAIASILLSSFALHYATSRKKALIFSLFVSFFSLWLIGDLLLWNTNTYHVIAAVWSVLDYINILFFLSLTLFLFIDFYRPSKLPWWAIGAFIAVLIFPFLMTVSGMSVSYFDQPNCEMYENDWLSTYKVWVEAGSILLIAIMGIVQSVRKRHEWTELLHIGLLTTAAVLFMGIFAGSEYIATITDIYEINLYALFTLPIFMFILTYAVTEQGMFRTDAGNMASVRLLLSVFVIVGLMDVVLADTLSQHIVSGIGVAITLGFGVLLWKGASRERQQRTEIEALAKKLEQANKRLRKLDQMKSEFVSIASHQLRSPLTSIRGYASMLLEGSYGKLPQKAHETVEKIANSSKLMAMSVEDYLNVSRIESGNMKYNYSDFNIKDLAESVADELRPEGMKRGLLILFKSDLTGRGIVHADVGKTKQIIQNIVDNAMKYTPKGTIRIVVHDDKKAKVIFVDVVDTGIGMSTTTQHAVFEKFERAQNANEVNVTGTGLGLYVARTMAQAMGGDIIATSQGEGKGSLFSITFPMAL